ncbi:MAG TPA: tetratricopeptide repeat protein, partial [Victivallales bacterium]|nr:tetratricopeptide repeat protein [Victivallales bacterium]
RCFAEKKQYDLAIEQFTKAISEMIAMDKQKMDALYHLGICYENAGNKEKALECYKEIYQANIKYKDVGERIQRFYNNK